MDPTFTVFIIVNRPLPTPNANPSPITITDR